MAKFNSHFKLIRGKHDGGTAILMAPGSSLLDFKDDFPRHYIRMAVNGSIIHDKVRENLDYYVWAGDINIPKHYISSEKPIRESIPKLPKKCKRYVCCWTDGSIIHPHKMWKVQTQIHPDEALKLDGEWNLFNQNQKTLLTKNIEKKGLNAGSVIFQALNILLHMGIKNIILVGADCGGGHSYKKIIEKDKCGWGESGAHGGIIKKWILVKEWISVNYPDVNITVKNPVHLKIFKEQV